MQKKSISIQEKRKLVAKLEPKSPITEQYRTIRTNIQFASVDKEIKSITVTSSGPAEGKSTTIANLAVVFAQQGKKVLLIDADMRKPTVHYTLQLPNTIGLTNILTKQVSLKDAVRETDVEGLFAVTSGPIPPNPAELLGSASMEQLIAEITDLFDLVLFDTPPLLVVTDAQILADKTDGTILVVSSGRTDREEAKKAKALVESTKGKLLGAILNNKKQDKSTHYYYYYENS